MAGIARDAIDATKAPKSARPETNAAVLLDDARPMANPFGNIDSWFMHGAREVRHRKYGALRR
jgi:hypothetical protein